METFVTNTRLWRWLDRSLEIANSFKSFICCRNVPVFKWKREMLSIFLSYFRDIFREEAKPCLTLFGTVQTFILNIYIAPCKGIHDSLGFWIPPIGFRIPSTGFRIPAQWIPDSKKGWIPNFFSVLMIFFAFRFRVRILLYWKDVV